MCAFSSFYSVRFYSFCYLYSIFILDGSSIHSVVWRDFSYCLSSFTVACYCFRLKFKFAYRSVSNCLWYFQFSFSLNLFILFSNACKSLVSFSSTRLLDSIPKKGLYIDLCSHRYEPWWEHLQYRLLTWSKIFIINIQYWLSPGKGLSLRS